MNSKKGSHVGIVLSFIIFVIFIFFIYLVTQPAIRTEKKDNSLEYLANGLKTLVSDDVTSATVKVQSNQACVQLTSFLSTVGMGNNFQVGNYSGKKVQSQVSGNDLVIVKDANDLFFMVYESPNGFSNATVGSPGSCQALSRGSGYEIGLLKTEKIVVEPLINNLIDSYSSNYSTIKNSLQISQGNDFDFSFTYKNGTIARAVNPNLMIPNSTSVYAKNIPVTYLSSNSAIESGVLNVRIW